MILSAMVNPRPLPPLFPLASSTLSKGFRSFDFCSSGIPEEQKSKLLKPFERVDEARGNKGGSGLGLTIADRIIKAHDGKLELINRNEGGLDARITIPIITA